MTGTRGWITTVTDFCERHRLSLLRGASGRVGLRKGGMLVLVCLALHNCCQLKPASMGLIISNYTGDRQALATPPCGLWSPWGFRQEGVRWSDGGRWRDDGWTIAKHGTNMGLSKFSFHSTRRLLLPLCRWAASLWTMNMLWCYDIGFALWVYDCYGHLWGAMTSTKFKVCYGCAMMLWHHMHLWDFPRFKV
jgi:hypothetical protein